MDFCKKCGAKKIQLLTSWVCPTCPTEEETQVTKPEPVPYESGSAGVGPNWAPADFQHNPCEMDDGDGRGTWAMADWASLANANHTHAHASAGLAREDSRLSKKLRELAGDLNIEMLETASTEQMADTLLQGVETRLVMPLEDVTNTLSIIKTLSDDLERINDIVDTMWGIICNVSEGNWNEQNDEWQEATVRIRKKYFEYLNGQRNHMDDQFFGTAEDELAEDEVRALQILATLCTKK